MIDQPVKLIIEGIDYTNTKGIALGLRQGHRLADEIGYQRFTTIISTKWGNFKDFPWGKNLISFGKNDKDQAMRNFGVWAYLIEVQGNYNWIIDCFHISTQMYQQLYNNIACDFRWLEERLLHLGFHMVHVTQNPDILERTLAELNIGNIDEELEKTIREQDSMRQIMSKSILPKIELNISEMGDLEIIDNIIEWYEEVSPYTQGENSRSDKIFLPSCC